MGNLVALKDVEAFEIRKLEKIFNPQPATVISFLKKRAEKIQKKKIQQWGLEGVYILRVMISDYEFLMNQLSVQLTPEQLAEVTSLSAEEQIIEDLRRLNALVDSLEKKLTEKRGLSLALALVDLKLRGSEENSLVIEYLETSEYPIFQAMVRLAAYTSECGGQEAHEIALKGIADILGQMGALDSVNGIHYLLENILCETV